MSKSDRPGSSTIARAASFEPLETRQFLSASAALSTALDAPASDPALLHGPAKSGATLAARRADLLAAGLITQSEYDASTPVAQPADSGHTARPMVSGKTLALRRAAMGTYLNVGPDGRSLRYQNGTPFFYLADTAWHLFDKTNQKSARVYLENRAAKGFTVIQAEVNARFRAGNAFGEYAFIDNDPLRPNEDYFRHVDYVVNYANTLGMWVAFVPLDSSWAKQGLYTPAEAWQFGRFLGARYANAQIIWTLGGDIAGNDNPYGTTLYNELAAGIARGATNRDQSKLTMQYFPTQNQASTNWFNAQPWLDLNIVVSGHSQNSPNYNLITAQYANSPTRPVMDGESVYEDIPFGLNINQPRAQAWDVRKSSYWSVFAGAHGVTYGHNNVWQFAQIVTDRNLASGRWDLSLDSLGAYSMNYLKRLINSRQAGGRVPDQSVVTSSTLSGAARIAATRGADSSYALVYTPTGATVTVDLTKLSGAQVDVRWYNPANGKSAYVGRYAKSGTQTFTPPTTGTGNDWVLVVDDVSKNYGRP
ncbi:MAG TPA: glycoside hydrolase family 140 protein [Tepidisphaeraceae bacterium]|nr:glycoside hydrolase family 140 protein [Tepidisphaeraceae bacterium]